MTVKLKTRSIATVVLALGLIVLQPNWANATSSGTAGESDPPLTSTLTITDASGNVVSSQTSEGTLVSPAGASTLAAGPAGSSLLCNKTYLWTDSNGVFSLRHGCGTQTTPWGYRLSSANCGAATSTVSEAGRSWALQGSSRPRQAPHVAACSYQFHGTFNPSPDGGHISYADTFTWRVANNGTATLQIHGTFTTTGSPCSGSSC